MWDLQGQYQDSCGGSSPCALLLSAQHRLSEELRQRMRGGLDIGGGEHTGDHRDAIGTGVDDLMRIVDGDAADGKYWHLDVLLHLSKNPQRDIGALGLGGGGKRCTKGHVVCARLLGGHGSSDVSIARGADDGIGTEKGTGILH